jgi:hypothetical protein
MLSIKFSKKSQLSVGTIIILLIIGFYIFSRISSAIGNIGYGLTPPTLLEYQHLEVENLNTHNWNKNSSEWFHHASQGTATLPIPYPWLMALEAPKKSPWGIFFGAGESSFAKDYLLRLGFIEQSISANNPDGLPIGIAKTESIYFSGIDRKSSAAGFTCAACHTGQLVYDKKRYVVDGGPAMIDLGLLTRSLGAALGQTALASNFVLLNGRFERFAEKVLGSNDNIATRTKLKKDLSNTISYLIKTNDTINVTEGFTRLDALNRIGNQVFSADMQLNANYSPINAPVNFPHIWTTSWFDWVQYDGSIMQPLIRNTGEALGVNAAIDVTGPDVQRFASSVNVPTLIDIEGWLAGSNPLPNKKFNGLQSPTWPASFPVIDKDLAQQGKALYNQHCQGCHLPTIDSDEFWSDDHWKKIRYLRSSKNSDGQPGEFETDSKYLQVTIIPLEEIGTDSAQSAVLTSRTLDTTGLNLDTEICTPFTYDDKSTALELVDFNDSATSNFGLALGALVQRTNNQWFKQNYIAKEKQPDMEGNRPNCLQVGKGYKARPLNGIWATAPFLHNGSVANLYDLLSPVEQRPTFVELGNLEFDTEHVGIVQGNSIKTFNNKEHDDHSVTADYIDGRFILDTRGAGNHNTGHVFTDQPSVGKIGPSLIEEEKLALIEFLKTL